MRSPSFNRTLTCAPLAGVAALLLFVDSAGAVCPEPHPKVCAEFFKSDAVFVGTVLTERTVPERERAYDGWVYRLRVRQTFRGAVRDILEVFTENSSGRFPLVVGETYLLFASVDEGRLTIDNCGNSGPLSQLQNLIPQIRKIKRTSGAEIEGEVSAGPGMPPPAGITIVVRGAQKTYRGVTARDGWFHIHVPPGKYTIRAESSAWKVVPFDLSYDDPDRIVVHNGGCAELKFLASSK